MYTSFYKFNTKPFQISSDPKFLWLGEKHKEALATLKYGILDNKGFLLLTGDVGTGKTTLIHSLIESLGDDIIYASVPDPSLSKLDFLNYIAYEFGMEQEFSSKGKFLTQFRKFLVEAYEDKKKVLLIIDEAQLLTQELLEEIRLLSNIEKSHTKLINIFFVGQNEFNEILNKVQNRAVRQRLTLNYNIDPLTPRETTDYIKFRLKIAGVEKDIFELEALQQIFIYSGGFPRRINIICDHALLSGYVQENQTIGIGIIKECAKELKIPVYTKHMEIDRPGPPYQATVPAPRPVIIQQAPYEVPENNFFWNIVLGIIGLIACCILVLWLFFPNVISELKQNVRPMSMKISETNPPTTNSSDILKQKLNHSKKALTMDMQSPVTSPQPSSGDNPQKSLTEKKPQSSDALIVTKKNTQIALPKEKIIVQFKYDSNEFSKKGFVVLQNFSEILAYHPEAKIKITGYSDSEGYEKYNEKLSEFRANIVKSFLLGKGANSEQFEVRGLGSIHPIETNDSVWGRMMNRRVEIEVIQ